MGVTIRPIEKSDLEWARELRNSNRKHFFDSRYISKTQHRLWFNKLSHPFFVIELDGKQVGTIGVHGGEIHNILIDKKYRRKGVFTQVLALVEKIYGIPLFLEVQPDNHAAIRVYKRLGFIPSRLRMERR